ncbi:MAG: hypothetical protein ACFFD4_30900 [Candidatus Odinarchaeota archaeon]
MQLPSNIDLPFFAYGLFKPGQLGFSQIKDYVSSHTECQIRGKLYVRDALPLADLQNTREMIKGMLLEFNTSDKSKAYRKMSDMEDGYQYKWGRIKTNHINVEANILAGINPSDRGEDSYFEEWDGGKDPLFNEALEAVEEILGGGNKRDGYKCFFRLQMAYMLLWSSIERYASLRYGLWKKREIRLGELKYYTKQTRYTIESKILMVAGESAFKKGLSRITRTTRTKTIRDVENPSKEHRLDVNDPVGSIRYYRQFRHNVTHRGKDGYIKEFDRLQDSLEELLGIFKEMLEAAFG